MTKQKNVQFRNSQRDKKRHSKCRDFFLAKIYDFSHIYFLTSKNKRIHLKRWIRGRRRFVNCQTTH